MLPISGAGKRLVLAILSGCKCFLFCPHMCVSLFGFLANFVQRAFLCSNPAKLKEVCRADVPDFGHRSRGVLE